MLNDIAHVIAIISTFKLEITLNLIGNISQNVTRPNI